ncbi:O-carbamyltransferase, putative [Geotalea daltonii FRC-32]|uniref:O-carbamyltransferase, putative n=1 Tax=Geotalea daltonii (strain DSM 22248 / JCM 15807 / FRC-32) TaxID=316067 RepID=B9M0I6_GEODF|nr:carbamoyltransferase C-terminal domain-containing protein [Geotalea daltonii]ACM19023.1 O-carbamyltransferase, putative [Geotalea daltonii FRC-32]
MYILGLSFDYHDSAAALLKDGKVIAAAQEERFTRLKNEPGLPVQAVKFCLETAGITADQVDHVIFYEKPFLKFERIVKSAMPSLPGSRAYFSNTIRSWIKKGKFTPESRIAAELGFSPKRVRFVKHHESHAGAAFLCSPFDKAAIVTVDGVGEFETLSISYADGGMIERLTSLDLPHSLGLFYSAFTAWLGFKVDEDEYKVMGMAGFGAPRFFDQIMPWFSLENDGTFRLDQECFNFKCPETVPYTDRLVQLFGPPRQPETPFRIKPADDSPEEAAHVEKCRYYADIAASIQKCTEEVLLHVVGTAIRRTGCSNVCMAGGVALNSLANGRLKRELNCRLYIHPAAGDAGGALGAALYYNFAVLKNRNHLPLTSMYLGKAHRNEEIEAALKSTYTPYSYYSDQRQLIQEVARLLAAGKVIGWMQSRFEWGPRALGCRSILADPTNPQMQAIVNEKIKFREPFRPFAPAVLEERADEFFDIGAIHSPCDPEYFMLSVCKVREEKRAQIPSVTHVDGTARVQLVNRHTNPLYYDLISEFNKLTGVPVIMNTSYNRRGEPIVNNAFDALKTYEWSDMDCAVLGSYLIIKDK